MFYFDYLPSMAISVQRLRIRHKTADRREDIIGLETHPLKIYTFPIAYMLINSS